MTWSLFGLLRRRLAPARRAATTIRTNSARRARLLLETLEERTVPSSYSITANLNSTAIAPGSTLWLSSVVGSVTGVGSAPVTVAVTNQTISFSDTLNGVTTNYNLSLPNANLTLTPGGSSATTTFDSTNNVWNTNVPTGLSGNVFLSGYALALPSGLHSGDSVTWTGTFSATTSGISLNWAWGAAVYTRFNTSLGSLGVKPCDSSTASSYTNTDKAGSPESYKTKLTAGGTGSGFSNYTGILTTANAVTPTYTATYVSLAGTVYNDANGNGIYDAGDTGISGVTLTLTGTTTGGQAITAATTTTAADGTYSFTMDGSGNALVAGTYQVAETQPTGYYQGSNNVGTDNGATDGTLVPVNTIGSIVLRTGDNGINYNFGNVNPFTSVTPAYPYSSSNPNTNVVFNESTVLAGASVNVANSTLDMWYSDEHALNLGVSSVTVISATGHSTTTNYTVSPLTTDPEGVTNPSVGDMATTGDQAAVDTSGRLLYPTLYITDITANPNSTSGDWQNGGTAIAPSAVYGSWKSYTITVDHQLGTITDTAGADPTNANDWTQLGAGADTPPSTLPSSLGYCTDVQWNLNTLYSQGLLIPGHSYRFYFIVHDGDQIHPGGDCGQAAYDFTYRGPVTIAGNVYKDVYGNGVDGAGDSGIGGVTLNLTGTTNTGSPITATTTTAADGTYLFTKDSNGNLLQGGTYQIAETQPAGYLPGYNTVGLTDWGPGYQVALAGTNTNGSSPGYVHEAGNAATETTFSGTGALDTKGISNWRWANGTVSATDDIVDAYGVNFNDALTGHNFILAGLDRYANTAGTTAGFWAFQNSVSVNANGTFSGVHANGDLYFVVNVTVNGAASVNVYEWTGNDATGSLTAITPAAGATFVNVNTSPASVPWSFVDNAGNTAPQAGEYLQVGVDLNAIFGLTVPHFASFLAETRASSAAGAALLDFAAAALSTVSGSFTADGTLIPVNKIGNIVASDGQNGINYNFGNVQPVTVSGLVYHDVNGNGLPDSGEPGIGGVALTLTGTNNLGQSVTATTTTAANGTYSFSTDNTGKLLPPGTYQIAATTPSGYLTGGTNVGTDNGATDGTVVTSGTIGSIVEHTGDNGINYDFGEYHPITVSGTVYQDTNGSGVYSSSSDPGIAGVTLTLSGTNGQGQPITATTTTAANGTYSFSTDSGGNQLRPGTYIITETAPSGYLPGAAAVGTVNGTADGSAASPSQINSIAVTSGQSGVNYNFGDFKPVSLAGTVYQDSNGNGVFDAGDSGIAGVTLTLTGTNGLGQAVTATVVSGAGGAYGFSADGSANPLRPGTYVVTETAPSGYVFGSDNVGTVNGVADGTATSATKISSIVMISGNTGLNYNFGNLKPVTLSGTVYHDANDNGVFDAGDSGMAGITLTLTGTNGLGQAITATTTTAAGGTYSFSTDSNDNLLRPGTYQIVETPPSGYVPGTTAVGTVGGSADGTLVSSTTIGAVGLTSGQSGINYNFGEVKAVSAQRPRLPGHQWQRRLRCGRPGMAGVTLTLSGTNDRGQSITATTTTGANGTFSFTTDNSGNLLRPGTYTITETLPAGYLAGTTAVGTVNGVDRRHRGHGGPDRLDRADRRPGGRQLPLRQRPAHHAQRHRLPGQQRQQRLRCGRAGRRGCHANLDRHQWPGPGDHRDDRHRRQRHVQLQHRQQRQCAAAGHLPDRRDAAGRLPRRHQRRRDRQRHDRRHAAVGQPDRLDRADFGPGGHQLHLRRVAAGLDQRHRLSRCQRHRRLRCGRRGISGVTLTLTGTNGLGQSVTATTVSAADGTYSFSDGQQQQRALARHVQGHGGGADRLRRGRRQRRHGRRRTRRPKASPTRCRTSG